jgi:hypothetical protein
MGSGLGVRVTGVRVMCGADDELAGRAIGLGVYVWVGVGVGVRVWVGVGVGVRVGVFVGVGVSVGGIVGEGEGRVVGVAVRNTQAVSGAAVMIQRLITTINIKMMTRARLSNR